jgi:hypothetical protein
MDAEAHSENLQARYHVIYAGLDGGNTKIDLNEIR